MKTNPSNDPPEYHARARAAVVALPAEFRQLDGAILHHILFLDTINGVAGGEYDDSPEQKMLVKLGYMEQEYQVHELVDRTISVPAGFIGGDRATALLNKMRIHMGEPVWKRDSR